MGKPSGSKKRRAKQSKSKSPGLTAGLVQGSKGPSQDQEISSSDDTEADEVEVMTSSDEAKVAPPTESIHGYTDPSSDEEVEPIRARCSPRIRIQIDSPIKKSGEPKPPAVRAKIYQEVVIVGVPEETTENEVQVQTGACKARRILKRRDGKRISTTAVVISFEGEPPQTVHVDHQRYKTRPFIRQATRCYRCQGWNHTQGNCKKQPRCARCGDQHPTTECKVKEQNQLKCANCKGGHSAASPTCPAFQKIQDAWGLVATEKKTYVEAIKSISRQAQTVVQVNTKRGRPTSLRQPDSVGLINAIPTQVMKAWATKPKNMKSIEVQTDEAPKEVAVQTTRDMECQTDFPSPVDHAQQTSADIGTQTIEVVQQAVQTSADMETQTLKVEVEIAAEEKYYMVTMVEMISLLVQNADTRTPRYKRAIEKFNYIVDKMAQNAYPMEMTQTRRPETRQSCRGRQRQNESTHSEAHETTLE